MKALEFYTLSCKYLYSYFRNNRYETAESVFKFASNNYKLLEKLESHCIKTTCRLKKVNSSNEPSNSNLEGLDVTSLKYPGVYEILDMKNNKSYYGESTSLFRRMMHHHQGLIDETHDCKALKAAFKEQGKPIEGFRFIVLKSGPEWGDKDLRLEYERQLIAANKHRCYNTDPDSDNEENKAKIRKPFMYNGKYYTSTREAAAAENMGRTTIRRHLENPNYPNAYYLAPEVFGQIPVFAKQGKGLSVLFNSIGECVHANYATNVQNARRKIQRKEEGWRYAHLDPNNKPLRIAYTLKPGEMSYEQYVEICSFVYLVNFILENSK